MTLTPPASAMKAVRIDQPGDSSVLSYMDVPCPEYGPNDVLVRIFAAGVNPVDAKVRQRGGFIGNTQSFIPGCDGAGVVVAVGAQVQQWVVGDAVYYCYGGLGQSSGNYAEYACVPQHYIASKPENISMIHAAASPLVLITAWEALFDRGHLQSGQTVFIHGGTGGVGHVAIQLAHIAGCKVACSVGSPKKAELAKQLGADFCIQYQHEEINQALLTWTDGNGVDLLLDTVGGDTLPPLLPSLASYGVLISLLQFPNDLDWKLLRIKNITMAQELMLTPMLDDDYHAAAHQAAILAECAQMIDGGTLSIHVSEEFPLTAAQAAHDAVEQGNTLGKIVLNCVGDVEEA